MRPFAEFILSEVEGLMLDRRSLGRGGSEQRSLRLTAQQPQEDEFTLPEAVAAEAFETQPDALPQSQRLPLADGSLICTLYRNEDEQIVLEFRSEAHSLKHGGVYFAVKRQDTGERVFENVIALLPDARGILTGSLMLGDLLNLTRAYEIDFDPVPLLQEENQ